MLLPESNKPGGNLKLKRNGYHVVYEQVADPFGILAVIFVALLWLCIFEMRKGNETGFFEDVEDRTVE